MPRFTPAQLEAARDRLVPDVVADGLRVLFCGINPGLMTAATGHHFARPGNRFWPVLHRAGFTPRQLLPSQQAELLAYGIGVTNVVARATARADELGPDEYREGGRILTEKVTRLRPAWLAVVGVTAYRAAFGDRRAAIGRQPGTVGGTRVWVLPNPSGLNAHWTLATMAEEFARLRAAVEEHHPLPVEPTGPAVSAEPTEPAEPTGTAGTTGPAKSSESAESAESAVRA